MSPPSIASVSYDAFNGQLILTGANFTTRASDFKVTSFSISGDGGHTYQLTNSSKVSGTPTSNSVTIQISATDQLAVNGLLNHNGQLANNGAANILAAGKGWDKGAKPFVMQSITVSDATVPTLSAVSYNAAKGVLTFSGSLFVNNGHTNGINLSHFTLSDSSGNFHFNFSTKDIISKLQTDSFTITLTNADKATLNQVAVSNATLLTLSANSLWDSDNGAAINGQAVTVNGLKPVLSQADYDAATGIMTLSGSNFSSVSANYKINDFHIKGDGAANYILSLDSYINSAISSNSIAIQLSVTDQLAVDGLLNQNGAKAGDGKTLYQLSASKGWDGGNNPLGAQGVMVSNAVAPSITAVSYDTASGVFSFSGSHLVKHANSQNILLSAFKIIGNGSYTFSTTDTFSNFSASGFSVALSKADKTKVNTVINSNGTETFNGTAYNIRIKSHWDGDSSPAISTLGLSASGYNPLINQLLDTGIRADAVAQISNDALSYSGMLKILNDIAARGSVTANIFHDLTALVANFNTVGGIQVSPYLYNISNKLINGDPTNATWTGGAATAVTLGNLTIGSSADQIRELIQKWFLGGDLPATFSDYQVSSSHYLLSSSPIFNAGGTPVITDINQGHVNDCFLLAALAEVAKCESSAITTMLTDNGNGTYGVRFFIDGVASYITVNKNLLYENSGTLLGNRSNSDIWASLIEIAYIQLNESGLGNAWSVINGGYSGAALTLITDKAAYTYNSSNYNAYAWTGLQSSLIKEVQDNDEVIFDCYGDRQDNSGRTTFVSDHSFCVVGYDSVTGDFILRNPWGVQTGQTWDTTFEASMADLQTIGAGQIDTLLPLDSNSLQEPAVATGFNNPTSTAVDNNGNIYVADSVNNAVEVISTGRIAAIPVLYLFDNKPGTPVVIDHYFKGNGQIELSQTAFGAFANTGTISATNFSNAGKATSHNDFLYYNKSNGGVYYDAHDASQAVEIAIVGLNSHPAALSVADFQLVS